MRTGNRARRGVTLVETMISLTVLAFGLVGIMQLQLISVRSNVMSRRMATASALATDLIENISLWPYTDARLASTVTVASTNDPKIKEQTDLGRKADLSTLPNRPHFSEGPGANAVTASALSGSGRTYDGISSDLDGDGVMDYERYWSVFKVDANADGVEEGKVVVVTIRWKEPNLGFRQFAMTTFRYFAEGFSK